MTGSHSRFDSCNRAVETGVAFCVVVPLFVQAFSVVRRLDSLWPPHEEPEFNHCVSQLLDYRLPLQLVGKTIRRHKTPSRKLGGFCSDLRDMG